MLISIQGDAQFSMFFSQNTSSERFNVENATYTTSYNLTAYAYNWRDIYVYNDTCMFVVESSTNRVYHFSITGSGLVYRKYGSLGISGANSIDFKIDGTKMYVSSRISAYVYEYNLSTAWDVSSISLVASKAFTTYSLDIGGIKMGADGLSITVGSESYDAIKIYKLSTAWSIVTATTNSYYRTEDISTNTPNLWDLNFLDYGRKIVCADASNQQIDCYELSTPYDINSMSYTGSLNTSTTTPYPVGMGFNSGTKMWLTGNNSGYIYEYNL